MKRDAGTLKVDERCGKAGRRVRLGVAALCSVVLAPKSGATHRWQC